MADASDDMLIERFEAGEDMAPYFDFDRAASPNREMRRVSVDLPVWMIEALDEGADDLSVSRQALIASWLAERIREEKAKQRA